MPLEHPVEIKMTIGGDPAHSPPDAVDKAVDALGLPRGRARRIWFLEDLTAGLPQRLPMLDAGQIFRVRLDEKKDGDWEADATVKLRPARRTQLAPPWHRAHTTGTEDRPGGDGYEYRIEEDWTGTRRALAASLQVMVDADRMTSGLAAAGGRRHEFSPRELFTDAQQDYLSACADRRVVLDALTALGPIEAVRWKDREIGGFDTKVERWTLDGLDFLEVSIQLKAGSQDDLLDRLLAFHTAVAARGLSSFGRQDTKTRRILEYFAHRVGG